MAQVTICDGTGRPITGETHQRGFVIKRDYCEESAKIVDEYQREIDELHDRLAQAWTTDLAAIRARYRTILKHLPDDNGGADDQPD